MSKGSRKDCRDIAPQIRASFVRAVKRNGGSGYLADMMQSSLEKDFVGTLNAVAKFNPRTSNVNQTNTLEIKIDSSVNTWIEGFNSGVKSLEQLPANTLEAEVIDAPQTVVQAGHATIEDEAVG